MKQDLKVLGSKVGSQTIQGGQGSSDGTGLAGATDVQAGSIGKNTGSGKKDRHDGSSNMSKTHNPVNAMTHTTGFEKPGPLNITTLII